MRSFAVAALVVLPATIHAAELPRREYRVDFEAKRVTVDPDQEKLDLEGDVRVLVGRYRLTSDRLHLTRGPYGVEVEGGGRIAFCPCPNPPLSLGFSAVTLAPPTDVLVAQPTLRVGSVPVLWLPYLWLRSRDRISLLFPRFEWRGQDGLLVGSGLHLPLVRSEPGVAPSTLEVGLAGYSAIGARVDAALATPNTTSRVSWDYVDQEALFVDMHGAVSNRDGATGAFRVDAARGPRARIAPTSLDEAARRYDRALFSVSASGPWSYGMGLRADAARAEPIDEFGSRGPLAHIGGGGALGSFGTWDASIAAASRDSPLATDSEARQLTAVTFDARPGPLATSLLAYEQTEFVGRSSSSDALLRAGSELSLGLPLVRRYERVSHFVTPLLRGAARAVRFADDFTPGEDLVLAAAGIDSLLGDYRARWGAGIEVQGGLAGGPSDPEPVVAGRIVFDTSALAVSAEGVWTPDVDQGGAVAAKARIGERAGVYVGAGVEGASDGVPIEGRRFFRDGWAEPEAPWFDRAGWTTGGELGIHWLRELATVGSFDVDATHEELLGVRGLLRYRHSCACLSAETWAAHRLGRGGFDAGFALDLMP